MAQPHPRTCSTSQLEYNILPPVQNIINNFTYIEYPCLTNSLFDQNVPLEFRIDKTNELVDITGIYLGITVSVTRADGSELEDGEAVSTVNNFGYSLFSSVDVYIHDQKVSSSQGCYAYLMYLKMLLFTTENEKKYCLRPALWRRDDPGFMDTLEMDVSKGVNRGFVERAAYIAKSQNVRLFIKLVLDFSVANLLPEQTEIFLRLNRNPASACLMAKHGEYKIKISQAKIFVPKYRLSAQGAHLLTQKFHSELLYHASRYTTYTKMVGKSDQNCDWTPITGLLPRRLFVFQTLNSVYNGAIDKNPFNFQTFNIRKIRVSKNGKNIPTDQGISVVASEPVLLYCMTLEALNCPQCISFTSADYANGYMVAVFDLTGDGNAAEANYVTPDEHGTVRIQIDYDKPLEESVTVFCVTENAAVLRIDRDRNVNWLLNS